MCWFEFLQPSGLAGLHILDWFHLSRLREAFWNASPSIIMMKSNLNNELRCLCHLQWERERVRKSSKRKSEVCGWWSWWKRKKTVCEKHKRAQFEEQMGIHFPPHTVFHKHNGNNINENQTKSSETELHKLKDTCTSFWTFRISSEFLSGSNNSQAVTVLWCIAWVSGL